MRIRRFLSVTLAFLSIGVTGAKTQQRPPEESRTFQFVSIRFVRGVCPAEVLCVGEGSRLSSPSPASISVLPGGRFEARNQSFENLARLAFGFEGVDPRNGIVNTPRVLFPDRERFDITAMTDRQWSPPPAGERVPPELRPMLRALLEQRFQMTARLGTKKVDVYAVRLANQTGEPGPGLRPSANECRGPYTDPPEDPVEDWPACPFRLEPNRVEAGSVTMTEVAQIISRIQGNRRDRPIVDGTGMQGTFDLQLSIDSPTQGRATSRGSNGSVGERAIASTSMNDRWPIVVQEALREQLGLKLEKAELPIPTLTIESAKRPQED